MTNSPFLRSAARIRMAPVAVSRSTSCRPAIRTVIVSGLFQGLQRNQTASPPGSSAGARSGPAAAGRRRKP